MSFRDTLQQNRGVIGAIAAVILIVAVLIVLAEYRRYFPSVAVAGAASVGNVYFYDLGSNQLIVEKSDMIPPIPAPSGKDKLAVRAYVYSCGDCAQAATRKVAYLEMFTPAAVAEMDKAGMKTLGVDWGIALPPDAIKGWMVKAGDQEGWVPRHSPEGDNLVRLLITGCGDPMKNPASQCLPPTP